MVLIRLLPLFGAFPLWANLYFYLPLTETMKPGEIAADFGAAYSFFNHPDRGEEDRYYVPDLRLHGQLSARMALSIEYFGVQRTNPPQLAAAEEGGSDFKLADFTLGAWVDLRRKPGGALGLKGFFKVKIPNADEETYFGSDQTDAFLGFTGDWRGTRGFLSGVARLDILGRPDMAGEQWDYIVLALHGGFRLGKDWSLLGEGWHRTRSTDETSLISLGFDWRFSKHWRLIALAGKGNNHDYVPGLDSNMERQYSLRLRRQFTSSRLSRWIKAGQ